jgi:hypothetical protein
LRWRASAKRPKALSTTTIETGHLPISATKLGLAIPVGVGDFDNNGLPDLLVTCFGGIVLYRNNGDGRFTDAPKQAGLGGDSG